MFRFANECEYEFKFAKSNSNRKFHFTHEKFAYLKKTSYICIRNHFIALAMDLVSRLKKYIDHTGLPVTQFADACSIPRPTMSQLLSGRNKKVSNELIAKLHDTFPDLNVLWLMFGQGSMLIGENIAATEPQNPPFETNEVSQDADIEAVAGSVLNFGADKKNGSEKIGTAPMQTHPSIEDNLFTQVREMNGSQYESTPSPALSPRPIKKPNPPAGSPTQPMRPIQTGRQEPQNSDKSIEKPATIPVDPGKRVINIIVYYSDNSFQSFVPEP